MSRVIFVITALALEISSMSTAFLNVSNERIWILLLLQHGTASVMLALFMWEFLPEKFRQPRARVMLLLFNFCFFIPFLGWLGVLSALLISSYRRREIVAQPFANVALPEFVLSRRVADSQFRHVGIRSRLAHASVPTQQRLQSLLALQGMPSRVASPLLQNMLSDASDDIRLVAYGLLDSQEKEITGQINHELAILKKAEGKELRLIGQRHLAELYWELAYSGLARDDLRSHALNQALFYANSALQLAPQETGLWFLKGRILHEMKRGNEAYQVLEKAVAYGLPESRALPYIVEILFERGDYKTVRSLLARLSISQVTPVMKGVIRLWAHSAKHNDVPEKAEGV